MASSKLVGGRYEIGEEIGRGGSSFVYRCTHVNLETEYALKVVDKKKIGNISAENEAFILRDLKHRNIPRVIDIFEENDLFYIVREYCYGENMRNIISTCGPMHLKRIYKISLQIADVLDYVHSQNPPMIYRDLKPSNIIIDENDNVKLIDFGISRKFSEEKEDDTQYMGSQKYAAPEQFGVSQSTPQTDIYSFALLQYYMFTGEDYIEQNPKDRWNKFIREEELRLKSAIIKGINIEPSKRQKNIKEFMIQAFGTYEENTEMLPQEKLSNIRDFKKIKESMDTLKKDFQKINIGFMGIKNGVGVSHIALNTAITLKKRDYKVILIESSGKRGFESLYGFFNGDSYEDKIQYGVFNIDGIQFYSGNSHLDIPTILSKDYDIAIFDFGSAHRCMGDFLRMQTKIFVIPSSPYSLNENISLIPEMLKYRDVRFCFNFASKKTDEIGSWLKIPKQRIYKTDFLETYSITDTQEDNLLKLCKIEKTAYKTNHGLLKRLFG